MAAVLEKIGAPPAVKAPDGMLKYTLPTIYEPNTKAVVSESVAIVRYVEKTFPDFKPTLVPSETDACTPRSMWLSSPR